MLISRFNLTNAVERPGNYFLAQMSHEATMRSLLGFAGPLDVELDEALFMSTLSAQDGVDEASIESFPASDPPSYGSMHA